ncbi:MULTISPECIES: polysialyltransferase family glycosyltransferase [unclassified Streptomyces]|uniref:polysialyltransferase family glycosyltransferase n=1 Tax=unclassified Streptomyces TaxID=2593676 RepID=UPI00381B752D
MATTQIFFASSLFGAATVAAAIDSGCFADADRRLLLVSNNAAVPETTPAPDAAPGFERLRDRFDGVLSWNEAVSPFHPAAWSPRADDVPLWERHLRRLWRLGDDRIDLVLESLQVAPALSVARLFPDAALDVYADGLMSYGPTRNRIDPLVGERVRGLFHLDLVPGLRPLLLAEFGAEPRVVPAGAFAKVVDELSDALPDLTAVAGALGGGPLEEPGDGGDGPAVVLGQYLAALGILSRAEEEELHARMVRAVAGLGHRRIVFKAHPAAPAAWGHRAAAEAAALGVELTVVDRPVLAEVLYRRLRPSLVAGCFSTGLLTAASLHGIDVARFGTGGLLERLTPYRNSNRVPLMLVDALVPDLEAGASGPAAAADERLTGLLDAVGFAMQPQLRHDLRPLAEHFLRGAPEAERLRLIGRRRLTSLGLPGGVPVPRHAVVRRAVRRARGLKRAVLR